MVYCGIIFIPGGSMFVGTKNVPGSLGCNFVDYFYTNACTRM